MHFLTVAEQPSGVRIDLEPIEAVRTRPPRDAQWACRSRILPSAGLNASFRPAPRRPLEHLPPSHRSALEAVFWTDGSFRTRQPLI
jgi:hypothetical protein